MSKGRSRNSKLKFEYLDNTDKELLFLDGAELSQFLH